MSDQKPVVVYGASGYTGRLVCEYLREYNIPFVAAGRSGPKTEKVMEGLPGVETADYEVVEVEHTVEALTDLFKGAKVVCNMVGPFMYFGTETVEAALAAGCNYLDTTGEQDWVLKCKTEWGQKFADKGLVIAPNIAQMFTNGEIAAELALETPGVDTLDMLVMWKGQPTIASTASIFSTLKADWFYLEDDQYVMWDPKASFDVPVPGQHTQALTIPWGGTAHPIWFKDDPRVRNVKCIGAVSDRGVMEAVIATKTHIDDQIKTLPADQQDAALAEVAKQFQAAMPPRERTLYNTTLDSVHGSGPMARVHVVLHGNSNYKQTALQQVWLARNLLNARPRRAGFSSACQAYDYRSLLGTLQAFGLMGKPQVTVNS